MSRITFRLYPLEVYVCTYIHVHNYVGIGTGVDFHSPSPALTEKVCTTVAVVRNSLSRGEKPLSSRIKETKEILKRPQFTFVTLPPLSFLKEKQIGGRVKYEGERRFPHLRFLVRPRLPI